ncbi:FHA domain-containing protein [bacterium]|nr:FHA domain-containing protein [bacterium]
MAEQSDILGTIKGSLGLAGKLAGKGFNEVSGLIKGDESQHKGRSGVYWQRGPWTNSDLTPDIDYMEAQELGRFKVSIVKRVTTSKSDRAFTQACGCCVTADLQGAEDNAKEAVESDPQCTDGYFLLGCLYLENNRAEEASANFQKALLCQQGLGTKFKKSLPSFRMVMHLTPSSCLALYPDLLGVNVLLALAQRKAGQPQAAISTMQQLLGVMPTEPMALFFMAVMHLESAQYSAVVEELRDVLPGSTLQVANLLLLGYACSKLGEAATAREVYRSALEKNDYDPLMHLDLNYALNASLGSAGKSTLEDIYRECPSYQPFFERLGLRLADAAAVPTLSPSSQGAAPGGAAAQHSSLPSAAASPQSSLPTAALAPNLLMPQPTAASPGAAGAGAPGSDAGRVQPLPFVPGTASSAAQASAPERASGASAAGAASAASLSAVAGSSAAPASGTAKAPVLTAPDGTQIGIPKPVHKVEPLPPKRDGNTRLVCAERGMEFVMTSAPFTVGREEGDCCLPFDSAVSRVHARLIWEQGRYLVEDLNSTNGTWLNGYRLNGGSRYEVNRGDVLQFGCTKFRLE